MSMQELFPTKLKTTVYFYYGDNDWIYNLDGIRCPTTDFYEMNLRCYTNFIKDCGHNIST